MYHQMNNRTRIMDLNMDVQFLILENLNLTDLLSIAQTNQHLSSLAVDVFRRTFSSKTVMIHDPNFNETDDNLDGNVIYIENVETISKMLKYFGAYMTHINAAYGHNVARVKSIIPLLDRISSWINLYCSENLIHLQIDSFYDDLTLSNMNKPFKRVENVTIRGRLKELSGSSLNFNELFPALRRLYLPFLNIYNKTSLLGHFPHLEHIEISTFAYTDPSRVTEASVEFILRKNPQIRSIKLSSSSLNFLKILNDLCPNLEWLELDNFEMDSENKDSGEIVFKNVKTFKVYSTLYNIPRNVRFTKLIQFHTDGYLSLSEWGQRLLEKNKQLKKLYLDRGCVETGVLDTLTPALSQLVEISLTFCAQVDDESIIRFINNNQQMEKFHFDDFQGRTSNSSEILSRECGDAEKWIITNRVHDILIERRELRT